MGWVSTYKIMYTSDLSTFNPVVDDKGDKVFPGNFDRDTEQFEEFYPPIHAQYLKDLVPKLSPSTCECSCEPCPPGTKICPTSKLCLPLDKWCDGLQDCPDDEKDCTTTTPSTPKTTVMENVVVTTQSPATVAAAVTTAKRYRVVGRAPKLQSRILKFARRPQSRPKPKKKSSNKSHHIINSKTRALECPKVECPPGYTVVYTSTDTSSPRSTYGSASELPPPRPRYSYQRYQRGYSKGGYSKGGYSKGGYSKGGYSKGGYSKGGYSKGGYGMPAPRPNQAFSLDKPDLTSATKTPVPKQECAQFKCIPKLPPYRPGGGVTPPPVCSVVNCPPGYSLRLERTASGSNKCPHPQEMPPGRMSERTPHPPR
ncbi:hypothetical protein HF086_008347 [Spodoptera exigua]|uniref:F5/8 type C domain-containing protein n=1 Tax=Spodoptera exigua TaxID=7107 RepID=A0A922M3Q2_SPOEX|nr:hypothetical protein HF086_008347 [Spodoptera exigua]